jgi:adenylylsulfate kinase
MNPPTDEESLKVYVPQTEEERTVFDFIQTHPLAQEFRAKEGFSEVRPHMKIPEGYRSHNLTAGTLSGPGRLVVPPLVFLEDDGKSLVSIAYIGNQLCGHPGIIHGGLMATLLDEGLARCCFAALPHKMGMTANLNVNYRAPTMADSYVVLRAKTTKVEGRKAWVEGRIETLVNEGETPVVLVEATALFVTPRQAAVRVATTIPCCAQQRQELSNTYTDDDELVSHQLESRTAKPVDLHESNCDRREYIGEILDNVDSIPSW